MIDQILSMRADISRRTGAADDYGNLLNDWASVVTSVPCLVQINPNRKITDGEKVVVIEDIKAIFQSDANVLTGDRIDQVLDARGETVFSTQMFVDKIAIIRSLTQQTHKQCEILRTI